jgi:hypothetical protein
MNIILQRITRDEINWEALERKRPLLMQSRVNRDEQEENAIKIVRKE